MSKGPIRSVVTGPRPAQAPAREAAPSVVKRIAGEQKPKAASFTPAPGAEAQPKSPAFYRRIIDSVRSGSPELPPIPTLPASATAAPSGPVKVVMYVAHPDDDGGYAGGTLKKLSDQGHAVATVSLTHGEGGRVVEERNGKIVTLENGVDVSPAEVAKARDGEMAEAAGRMRIENHYLFEAKAGLDFGYTQSTTEVLTRWNEDFPGGLDAMLEHLVADLRARKPDVVMALMEEDPKEHGAHKASAILLDLAARLAADPSYGRGEPHVVRELVTVGSEQSADVLVGVDKDAWRHTMRAYKSQFVEPLITELDQELRGSDPSHERYHVRWRAEGGLTPPGGSLFESLVR